MEMHGVNVARVFVATISNDDREIARTQSMLEDVVAAAHLARPALLRTN
jgi:hypothetical protein